MSKVPVSPTGEVATTIEPVISDSAPRIPVNWWGIITRALVAFVMLMASNFIRIPLHELPGAQRNDILGIWINAAIFLVTPVTAVLILIVWMQWIERRSLRSIGFGDPLRILPGILGGTLVVAVPMLGAWGILLAISEPLTPVIGDNNQGLNDPSMGTMLAGVVFVIVRSYFLQGIPEELIFRGWLFSTTRGRPIFTVVWTTFAFTIPHLLSSGGQQNAQEFVLYLAVPLGMAVLAGAVVVWKGSVWWAAGTHGGMHGVMALLSKLFPVDLGVTAWMAIGFSQIVVGIAIIAWWHFKNKKLKATGSYMSASQ
ncbi:CPBP family intramembrane glutamic endopeptidase [Corynebacterium ulcerans]|uniref:CPBP family intramembrane glutamic endopeptidase n=1 Tax=Corynebacterium ulcerans TaxID=65058 RepID=UPI00021413AB|nr:CPBP family intramembrane glutamic endopeptidase [Corynebacterium ulcerans]AEG82778.1 putative membrane protein [Corynebacterium ulcerans BR-AD22]NOL58821.1 CPBP family intramembrane metalloprotease [Corynebacterium ulcerans]NOM03348.1 CPBP family intramembrane metalloprotease [Corynebacterium ulcerans]